MNRQAEEKNIKKIRLSVYKYDTIQLAITNWIISKSRQKVNLFVYPLIQVYLIDTNSGAAKSIVSLSQRQYITDPSCTFYPKPCVRGLVFIRYFEIMQVFLECILYWGRCRLVISFTDKYFIFLPSEVSVISRERTFHHINLSGK